MGLLFLPYTGMVLSFSVVGGMLADPVHWDRVVATVIIYFLGLGIGAHALDAAGSKEMKPWGEVLSERGLWIGALSSIAAAYLIQFNIRFYVFALIFVVFDVEAVFLLPWAAVFRELGPLAYLEGLVFIAIPVVALAYVWRKGDLAWVRLEDKA